VITNLRHNYKPELRKFKH